MLKLSKWIQKIICFILYLLYYIYIHDILIEQRKFINYGIKCAISKQCTWTCIIVTFMLYPLTRATLFATRPYRELRPLYASEHGVGVASSGAVVTVRICATLQSDAGRRADLTRVFIAFPTIYLDICFNIYGLEVLILFINCWW